MSDTAKPHPIPLYAVTIHNAAASGDLAAMKQTVAEAEAHLQQYGNVGAAVEALKVEIAKLEVDTKGKPFLPLYARPIEDAVKSGDLQTMKTLAAEAAHYKGGDISQAVAALHAEIKKLEAK
jgi:uncharacterized small protein (DUF1192 family)